MTLFYWRPRSDCNKNNSFKRRFPVLTRRSTVSQLLVRTTWLLLPTITAASPWTEGPPETRQKESSGHTPWRNICKRYAIRTCIGLIFERSSQPIEVRITYWHYWPLCELSRLVKKSIHCFSIPTHPIPWNWRVFPTSSTRSGRSLLFRLFPGPMSRQFLAGQSTWCTQGSQGKEWESKSLLQKLSKLQLTSTDFFNQFLL